VEARLLVVVDDALQRDHALGQSLCQRLWN
jgi:hypothetical protein